MKTLLNGIKILGIFLVVCLILFMLAGAFFAAKLFWIVLKLLALGGLITFVLITIHRLKK